MKLRYYIAALFMVLFTANTFAQKEKLDIDYDKKTNIATVNGTQVFKILKETNASGTTYTVQSLDGKTLITFVPVFYTDSREVSQSNPNGRRGYNDIVFEDAPDIKADMVWFGMNQSIKMIYENHLIVDGKLDVEAAKLFARKQGTVNTEKRLSAR